jgi:hypothetical protein
VSCGRCTVRPETTGVDVAHHQSTHREIEGYRTARAVPSRFRSARHPRRPTLPQAYRRMLASCRSTYSQRPFVEGERELAVGFGGSLARRR